MEIISQEWTKEGMYGVWKGSNITFLYVLASKGIESWARGLLSAVFNVPDPGVTTALGPSADVLDTNYPWASLGLAVAAAVLTGLTLAPLDLVRTK
jgi:fusion and transport protein UGO1